MLIEYKPIAFDRSFFVYRDVIDNYLLTTKTLDDIIHSWDIGNLSAFMLECQLWQNVLLHKKGL